MSFVKYFVIYAICAAAFVFAVYGEDAKKQCVQCSDYDSCKDTVNTTNVKVGRCNLTEETVCERYSFKDKTGILTVRGCVPNTTDCSTLKSNNFGTIKDNSTWHCYTCDKDLCNQENSASSIGVSLVSMIVAALISLYLK